ncbi:MULTISPECIES: DapH/DapD/GlmU-related protein [Limosilactobacillus]|uniref:Galactoside O-acetyltransferase n=1 Tax=Limosilactobacillus pontis DSM 8475 TaxID=1423794 RepID=A0A922TND5_9LACO|nr:DapH/DapD/GlmU-related protein [Limosilactobacillus pontis]KRM38017.1 galactoside O-acetyltransferase [Limosilactobacillus pontis DSM 8475]MCX2187435.1 sugar O-acetyltransferase [Limosilactobacillus pontis]MCX2189191.1 sugar O-acetyltransferase [Limosilactobacillus pontis]QFV01679.1 sugar O-acetyltransferase [Limosilactobacillus pontis]
MTASKYLDPQHIAELAEIIAHNQQLVQELNTGVHSAADVRTTLAQLTQRAVDPSVEVRLPFYTDYGRNIHFGKRVFINNGATFTDLGGIHLADDVLIGPNATLITVNHPLDPAQRRGNELKPVYIRHNAWIGANTTILPGVTVGENAVVAAGAVVTRNVPANTVVAGVPARVIKTIKHNNH